MKASLVQSEPRMLEHWETTKIYDQIREARRAAPAFIIHDGPPYANGNIHLGHALNKILKDFIVKCKTMEGFNAPFVPGWDCHGLPIEIKVDQELGSKKAAMQPAEIRQECRKYAAKYVDLHRRDFKRLGVLGRWEDPYLTMSASYESVIARAFLEFLEKGYVYKGLKPVHWCINCRTALAEAEVEHENHSSPSVWVEFPLASDAARLSSSLAGRTVSAIIWTTTPWTLPANVALAFHPSEEYIAVKPPPSRGDTVFIVARALLNDVASKCDWQSHSVVATLKGSQLEGQKFQHPFLDRDSVGILGPFVTMEQGTGIVHTAPGHGIEDFIAGEKYKLPVICPVDDRGRFTEGLTDYLGKNVFDANHIILGIVEARGRLLHQETLEHSYPNCWRCRRPVIFRATEQWFINLSHNDLRNKSLQEIRNVRWLPEWGEERISNMIAVRPDWCISRQRIWGVPIIIFYCESCNNQYKDYAALSRIVDMFARETSDVWYTKSAAELLPPGTKCSKCSATQFRKERDILDVWFDSGSSNLAVLANQPGMTWPADLYVEGNDQYRGWFHSSLLVGVGLRGSSPYRQVATHGWVLDEQSRAMSKSLGNVIEPQTIIQSHGAEILRLWVASADFRDDIRISKDRITRLSESYRKLRNTFRYCLANLYDFDPAKDQVPTTKMLETDQWALLRTSQLAEQCLTAYQEFGFHKVFHELYNFCTVDLSSFYLDITKDRLYTAAPQSHSRRSAQTALYRIADALVRLVAPIICFTADEVWSYLPGRPADLTSVHLAAFPDPAELSNGISAAQIERLANWDRLIAVRDEVLKVLETARKDKLIGNSLEARVELSADGAWAQLLQQYSAILPMLFIVSQVHMSANGLPDATESTIGGLRIAVRKADGDKCERCWNYSDFVGKNPEFPTICDRCSASVKTIVESAN